jgi:AcrR family transcriptional regulator
VSIKPTAERILDAAERLFAENGYQATSLGDVADCVGIRSPSLYNHFKNKEALYRAVLERLLEQFRRPFEEMKESEVDEEAVLVWEEKMMRQHIENPNLARLLTHSALSGEPIIKEVFEELFGPMVTGADEEAAVEFIPTLNGANRWLSMAYINIVLSYVTLAPLYKNLLGDDPLSEQSSETQIRFLRELTRVFISSSDNK